MQLQVAKKFLTVIWGFFECLLFGGTIFGWPSLVYVLEQDGVYSHVCHQDLKPENSSWLASPDEGYSAESSTTALPIYENGTRSTYITCRAQANYMNIAFTLGSTANGLSCLPVGSFFDKFGMRISRLVSSFLFITGFLLLSFTSHELPWLLTPGIVCVSVGNMHIAVNNMQISNLFGNRRSIIIAFYNGAIDASVVTFLLVKIAFDAGISRRVALWFLIGASSMILVSTYFLLPKMGIAFDGTEDHQKSPLKETTSLRHGGDTHLHYSQNVINDGDDPIGKGGSIQNGPIHELPNSIEASNPKDDFASCVLSKLSLLSLWWSSVLTLRLNYFLGTMNNWLLHLLNGDTEEVGMFINIAGYIFAGGVFVAPIIGLTIDSQVKKYTCDKKSVLLNQSAMGLLVAIVITNTTGVLLSCTMMVPNVYAQLVSFFLAMIFRAFLFSTIVAFVMIVFPGEHYGKMLGLTYTTSGLVCLVQIPLSLWVNGPPYDAFPANLLLLSLVITSFSHPINIYIQHRRSSYQ